MWKRTPSHDRRISRGDDFAGDAWLHAETKEIRWTVVGTALIGQVGSAQDIVDAIDADIKNKA